LKENRRLTSRMVSETVAPNSCIKSCVPIFTASQYL